MALSFCPNWGGFQQLSPEMADFQYAEAELTKELLCFCDKCNAPIMIFDNFVEHDEFTCFQNNTDLLPYFNSSGPFIPSAPELYPVEESEYYQYQCPKRARNYSEFHPVDFMCGSSDGSVVRPSPAQEVLPEFVLSPTELQVPTTEFSPGIESSKKSNGACLSAQSIAARQRRKRISEKTHELGKLIPGGSKMNTAEMLQAASKYVKYLQAQLGMLELMGSLQERMGSTHLGKLEVLASPRVQEKLYLEEKCMVPRELVETLAMDPDLQSNSSISSDLDCLLQTLG